MDKSLDLTTFGSFESAKTLIKLLRENPEFEKKVCSLVSSYAQGLAHIRDIKHNGYRKAIALLWRNDYFSRVNFIPEINTYTKCVMTAYFRKTIK